MAFQSPRAPDAAQAKAPVTALKTLWPFVMRQRGLFAAWLIALALSSVATLSLPVAVAIVYWQIGAKQAEPR